MSLNKNQISIVASLCLMGAFAFFFAAQKQFSKANENTNLKLKEQPGNEEPWARPVADPKDAHDYKEVLTKLESERNSLAARYEAAGSGQQAEVIAQARAVLARTIHTQILPTWYGTAWDFNGTTEVPQQGKIACGYFVSTVLRDAGWKVERTPLAQQASENIIWAGKSEQ